MSQPGCLGSAPAELPGTPAAVPGLWEAHGAGVAEVAQRFTFLPPSSFLGLIGLSVGIQVLLGVHSWKGRGKTFLGRQHELSGLKNYLPKIGRAWFGVSVLGWKMQQCREVQELAGLQGIMFPAGLSPWA